MWSRQEEESREDKTRQDKTNQDETRRVTTRTIQDETERYEIDRTRQHWTGQDRTRHDTTRHDTTSRGQTSQGKKDKRRQDMPRRDSTRHTYTQPHAHSKVELNVTITIFCAHHWQVGSVNRVTRGQVTTENSTHTHPNMFTDANTISDLFTIVCAPKINPNHSRRFFFSRMNGRPTPVFSRVRVVPVAI